MAVYDIQSPSAFDALPCGCIRCSAHIYLGRELLRDCLRADTTKGEAVVHSAGDTGRLTECVVQGDVSAHCKHGRLPD